MERYKRFFIEGVITSPPAKNAIYFAVNKEGTDGLIGFYNGALTVSQIKGIISQIKSFKGIYNLANPMYPITGKINSLRGMRVIHLMIKKNSNEFREIVQDIASKIGASFVEERGLLFYFKDYTEEL